LSPPLGEVRAGCQLELVRSVEGFSQPHGIAVSARGEIFVAEWGAKRVAVVSEEGAVLRRFDCQGSSYFVSVDAQGRVLVSLYSPKRLLRFAADGAFEREIGPLPAGGTGGGVCALRDGGIAFANYGSGTVTIFPPDLANPTTVSVGNVCGVAETREGHLLLTDDGANARVCDRAGRKLRAVAGEGTALQLSYPFQPAVSAEGAALIAAWGSNVVVLLDSGGAHVHSLALRNATGVAVLPSGLIVASTHSDGKLHFLRVRRA
jgi:streptogramin lyase